MQFSNISANGLSIRPTKHFEPQALTVVADLGYIAVSNELTAGSLGLEARRSSGLALGLTVGYQGSEHSTSLNLGAHALYRF